ncbi:hypothetical protein [Nonomuraea sp. bgisy101]|uniref:hypothetical protein n=1 Tax=Nonomuraea sp. bgisy101 TaxID=3413784 RepID=UPI003D730A0A
MENTTVVRVEAFDTATKKLGRWTEANRFEVRARRGYAVLDLRALPEGDVEVRVDAERSTLRLLLPDNAVVDQWDLRVTGRGGVKDRERPATTGGFTVKLVGEIRHGEIRVTRGGVATLTTMFSREFVEDVRRAHREGGVPTVHDPRPVG